MLRIYQKVTKLVLGKVKLVKGTPMYLVLGQGESPNDPLTEVARFDSIEDAQRYIKQNTEERKVA